MIRRMAERLTGINFERIRWCCSEYGIGHDKLASRLRMPGLTKALDQGSKGLTHRQICTIASFFGRELFFFYDEQPISAKVGYSPLFRTLAGQVPRLGNDANLLIRLVEEYREIYAELDEGIDEHYEQQPRPWREGLAAGRSSSPAALARAARRWLGLDATQVGFSHLRAAVEARGILVFVTTGHRGRRLLRLESNNNIRGFSLYDQKAPAILVRKMPNYGSSKGGDNIQAFTLMHELGHLLLHQGSFVTEKGFIFSRKAKERQANVFASNLLVPSSRLRQIPRASLRGRQGQSIEDLLKPLARRLGVNTMVLALRLLEEKLITQGQHASYERYKRAGQEHEPQLRAQAGGGGRNRAKETVAMFGKRYTNTVLEAYSLDQIDIVRASTFLGNLRARQLAELLN